ncbi:hypothetical protein ACF0H5_009691 [Mactra antiquata]
MWIVSYFISTVSANWDRVCPPYSRRPHPNGVCGSRIDEILSMLCADGYNEYPAAPSFDFRRKRNVDESEEKSMLHGFLIRRGQANSFLSKRSSYFQRGIVCECCYNSCSIMELFSYCRGSPGPLFGLFKRSTDRQQKRLDKEFKNNVPLT